MTLRPVDTSTPPAAAPADRIRRYEQAAEHPHPQRPQQLESLLGSAGATLVAELFREELSEHQRQEFQQAIRPARQLLETP
ncbi:MAG: hypothetical protein A2W26_05655 [Acidobacteria bacterium RBG_16_64_8]|jgi:hypothetical protein|nr:MAG: hypothetical protein A2W26_05655 [Acidobacteria bacterium RBG_16_64_8]